MKIDKTPIAGVSVVQSSSIEDARGMFARFYCEDELSSVLNGRRIVQANFSRTSGPGTVRGFHFQHPPHAEMKFIRCLRGKVWDVAVDLRAGSSTFLKWYAVELSPGNLNMMVIPEGCAHGFQVLEAESELLYLHTAAHAPAAEGGVRYDEPRVGVDWPLKVAHLSERDRHQSALAADFSGIVI